MTWIFIRKVSAVVVPVTQVDDLDAAGPVEAEEVSVLAKEIVPESWNPLGKTFLLERPFLTTSHNLL